MPKKIKVAVNNDGSAASVAHATPMANGKTYIRNPRNPQQILEIQ